MESIVNKLTAEQYEDINGRFEQDLGLSMQTLEDLLKDKMQSDENFKQLFAESAGPCIKQLIEEKTGKTLPDEFLTEYDEGTQQIQQYTSSMELTDDDLEHVSGGVVIIAAGVGAAVCYGGAVCAFLGGLAGGIWALGRDKD